MSTMGETSKCEPHRPIEQRTPNIERPTVIGRFVEVKHDGLLLKATVIDCVAGENLPKRVRVQSIGKIQGDVLMPGEYEILRFL